MPKKIPKALRSIRLPKDVDDQVQRYLKKNYMYFTSFITNLVINFFRDNKNE